MIPDVCAFPHHHALRHQPDKLTERRSSDLHPHQHSRTNPTSHTFPSSHCLPRTIQIQHTTGLHAGPRRSRCQGPIPAVIGAILALAVAVSTEASVISPDGSEGPEPAAESLGRAGESFRRRGWGRAAHDDSEPPHRRGVRTVPTCCAPLTGLDRGSPVPRRGFPARKLGESGTQTMEVVYW
jgi:hypothetical protein